MNEIITKFFEIFLQKPKKKNKQLYKGKLSL